MGKKCILQLIECVAFFGCYLIFPASNFPISFYISSFALECNRLYMARTQWNPSDSIPKLSTFCIYMTLISRKAKKNYEYMKPQIVCVVQGNMTTTSITDSILLTTTATCVFSRTSFKMIFCFLYKITFPLQSHRVIVHFGDKYSVILHNLWLPPLTKVQVQRYSVQFTVTTTKERSI